MLARLAILSAFLLSPVIGHGGGMYYEISGVNYTGTWRTVRDYQKGSIQRVWGWDAMIYDDPNVACGDPGTPFNVSHHAPTQAGETISISYIDWPHYHGPMMAYLAACPDEGCESVDVTQSIWFKIWEAGLLSGTLLDGEWAMKAMRAQYVGDVKNLHVPIPASVKPGKYLFKHDMANMDGGAAQLFPNCVQLNINGKGSSFPSAKHLVSFPDAYSKAAGSNGSWPAHGHGAEWLYVDHPNDTVSIFVYHLHMLLT